MSKSFLQKSIIRCLSTSFIFSYAALIGQTAFAQTDLGGITVTANLPPGNGGAGGGYYGNGGDTGQATTGHADSGPPLSPECEQLGMQRPSNCPSVAMDPPTWIAPSEDYWLTAQFSGSSMQKMIALYRTLKPALSTPNYAEYQAAARVQNLISQRTQLIVYGYNSNYVNNITFANMEAACKILHDQRSTLSWNEPTSNERLCNEALVRVTEEMGDGSLIEQLKDFLDNQIGVGTDWISWGPLKIDEAIPNTSLSQNWEQTRAIAQCADWNKRQMQAGCFF